jgi:hypothetical protein
VNTETYPCYYRARYYDPSAGRFISEDPTYFAGGLDFYFYVGNDPTIFVDPYGLQGAVPQPKQPKISGNTVYYICCKKGTFGFCGGSGGGGGNDWIGDCEKQHENQHIGDFKNGIVPRLTDFCSDPKNDGKAVLVNEGDEKNKVECSGYKRELQCLEPAGQQLDSIKQRRKFIQDQIKKYCDTCSANQKK